jgi:hypothetical protein
MMVLGSASPNDLVDRVNEAVVVKFAVTLVSKMDRAPGRMASSASAASSEQNYRAPG